MYNPYFYGQNPYGDQSSVIQGVPFVNGLEEAKNYFSPRGTKIMLMDKLEDKFYIKETTLNGISNINTYSFEKVEVQPQEQSTDYITRAEFDKWKEQYESTIQSKASAVTTSNDSIATVSKNNNTKSSKKSSSTTVTEQLNF